MTSDMRLVRARLLSAFLFTAIWAGAWDIWWHNSIGRDSFWIAPHLLLYSSVLLSIFLGLWTWWQRRSEADGPVWRKVAIALTILFSAAPLDELWHRTFGKEVFETALIVWSPPHLMIVFGLLGSLLYLLPILLEDESEQKRIFVPLAFAGIFHLLMFLSMPFDPLGAYHVAGFWGSFAGAAIISYIFCFSRDRLKGFGISFLLAVFYLLTLSVRFGDRPIPGTGIPPHESAPSWLIILAIIVPAILFDMFWGKRSKIVLGGVIGFFHAAILYGFASGFLAEVFQYGTPEMVTAIAMGTLGGIVGAFFSKVKFL